MKGKNLFYDGSCHKSIRENFNKYLKEFLEGKGITEEDLCYRERSGMGFNCDREEDGKARLNMNGDLVFIPRGGRNFVVDGSYHSFRKIRVYEDGFEVTLNVIDDLKQPWFGTEEEYEISTKEYFREND